MKKEVTIYGAGMSGLIAAINLAREGYDVTVHDRENGFGGDSRYNPSTHTTPMLPDKVSEYIGIDITPVFHPVDDFPLYIHDTRVQCPVCGLYSVERGNRPTSLDSLLYPMACELGVRFIFNSPLKTSDIPSLATGTIVACGLAPEAYDMLAVPYRHVYGWISRGDIDFDRRTWCWFDESINEYGYLSAVNNYYFDLLFNVDKPVSKDALERYKKFMQRTESVEHDNWEYISGAVPVGNLDNPRLVREGLIFCGTISGFMDPMAFFGINGAMISGKIAAMAVSDMAKAQREFARFSKNFKRMFLFKNFLWAPLIRPHVTMMEKVVKMVGPERLSTRMAADISVDRHKPLLAIPGFAHIGTCY